MNGGEGDWHFVISGDFSSEQGKGRGNVGGGMHRDVSSDGFIHVGDREHLQQLGSDYVWVGFLGHLASNSTG